MTTENEHREAIERGKREARQVAAESEQEKRLAEVETAITASKKALDVEATELSKQVQNDRITQSVAEERMAELRAQHLKLIDKMKEDIVDPIAKEVEAQAKTLTPEMPERTAVHVETSEHYRSLSSDARQDAIGKAITGHDDTLAVALITGRDELTDITREQLTRRISPGDSQSRTRIIHVASLVRATLDTIEGARR